MALDMAPKRRPAAVMGAMVAPRVRARGRGRGAAAKAAPKRAVRAPRMRPGGRGRGVAPKAAPKRAARVRHRPAARVGAGAEAILLSKDLSLVDCCNLDEIEVMEGTYWTQPIQAALKVLGVIPRGGEPHLSVQVLGTQTEELLRAATGLPSREMVVHLCGTDCPGEPHAEDLLHVTKLKKLTDRDREGWMSNLKSPPGVRDEDDELARLREEHAARQAFHPRGDGREREEIPAKEKDKKRRKSRSPEKKKTKVKVVETKDLSVVLGTTGVDPDPSVRRRVKRRAAKMAQSKKSKSSGSSGDTSSDSESDTHLDTKIFGGETKVVEIARKYPGALTCSTAEEVAETLVTQEGGIWDLQEGPIPPLFTRYFRAQLASKMSPAMARESHTLAQGIDFLLRGKIGSALDLLSQRLKALEMQSGGAHYSVAQQQEVLPKEAATMSTTKEYREAARHAREEGKAKQEAARPYGSRGSGSRGDDWQGNKSGGKKGGGKNKGPKGNGEKGKGRREEAKDEAGKK